MDAFSSAYSERLGLCKTYWHPKDSAWFKRWGEHLWGLLWVHCKPGCHLCAIAETGSNRSKALLLLTEKVLDDDGMARLKDDLEHITKALMRLWRDRASIRMLGAKG